MRFRKYFLCEKEGENGGGGGGTPDPKDQEIASLKAKLAAFEKPPKQDDDLADKARQTREENEKSQKKEKSLESALNFNIQSKEFLKNNQAFLPKTVEGIFQAAEKETYDSAVDKANAIKVGVFSEFFAVQANHDLLTSSQKIEVDEFLKLTKNGKQDRIAQVYSMIFEPTLETMRKIEKAKEVNAGQKDQTDAEKARLDRMQKLSRQRYLGEK